MKIRILLRPHLLCRLLLLCIFVELLPTFHANAEGISLRQRHRAEDILAGRRHFKRANNTIDTTAPADSSSKGAFSPDKSAADSQTSNSNTSNNNAGSTTSDSTSNKTQSDFTDNSSGSPKSIGSQSDNSSGSTQPGSASNNSS